MAADDTEPLQFEPPGLRGLARMSRREIAFILGAIGPGHSVLEVGTASGATAALIADARPGAKLVCIDAFGDAYDPQVVEEDGARVDNWRRNRRENMCLWLGTFESCEALRPRRFAFDVAIVDVDDPYMNVRQALHFAARMTKLGGTLFVHDYDYAPWPDVKPATDDFCAARGFRITGECERLRSLRQG